MPIPVEPGVVSVYVPNSAAETNIPVYVPWRNCKLSYAYTVCVTGIDTAGAMAIDLELDAASGTEIMTISVAASSSVGDIDEATFTSQAAGKNLSYDNTSRDAVNVEVDGSTTGTGAVMLYMYFEPWAGE